MMKFCYISKITRACYLGPFVNRDAIKKIQRKDIKDDMKNIDMPYLLETGEEKSLSFIKPPIDIFADKNKLDNSKIEHKSLILSDVKSKKVDLVYGRNNMIGGKDIEKSNKSFQRKPSVDNGKSKTGIHIDEHIIELPKSTKDNKGEIGYEMGTSEITLDEFEQPELNNCAVSDINYIANLMKNMHIMQTAS